MTLRTSFALAPTMVLLGCAACRACSDGMWSTYTRSAVIPSGWFPERLAPFAAPPRQ
jgi:hypothetical protein